VFEINKLGHTIGCIVIGAVSFQLNYEFHVFEASKIALMECGIFVGSYLPDVDAKNSAIKSYVPILKPYILIQKLAKKNVIANDIFRHRGALFHSWITVFVFLATFAILSIMNIIVSTVSLGLAIGVFGHHLLDMLTPAGLRWLYPLKKKLGIHQLPE
jgi:membrane-bound metal-dependent hydrolase YbcI (DUF457 family)